MTIIAKALNVNLANYSRVVEHSYFTKHAFARGEVVDSAFWFIPSTKRSCWRGIRKPPQDEDSEEEEEEEAEEEESEHVADIPQPTPLDDVPMITYPIQSAPGSSSDYPPILNQILHNQIAM